MKKIKLTRNGEVIGEPNTSCCDIPLDKRKELTECRILNDDYLIARAEIYFKAEPHKVQFYCRLILNNGEILCDEPCKVTEEDDYYLVEWENDRMDNVTINL